MGKRKQIRVHVRGQRRSEVDTRRLARAIVRLAVELDADEAQGLADVLEVREAERTRTLRRARAEQHEETDRAEHKGAA